METFDISKVGDRFEVNGIPDAAVVVQLDGPKANRLADLALHRSDLEFADQCLEAINRVPDEDWIIRQTLWRSAIVHFFKCFAPAASRGQLNERRVFKSHADALAAFAYLQDLRNKHFVHDDNPYSQCHPTAVLNNGAKPYKVEKVVCLCARVETLAQENFSNLKLLIVAARDDVTSAFDELCNVLTKDLELEPYEQLVARGNAVYRIPTPEDSSRNRRTT
jgi:hypothetical protein